MIRGAKDAWTNSTRRRTMQGEIRLVLRWLKTRENGDDRSALLVVVQRRSGHATKLPARACTRPAQTQCGVWRIRCARLELLPLERARVEGGGGALVLDERGVAVGEDLRRQRPDKSPAPVAWLGRRAADAKDALTTEERKMQLVDMATRRACVR
eukprot:3339710-Pleurochrysis_carterae.AAC.1